MKSCQISSSDVYFPFRIIVAGGPWRELVEIAGILEVGTECR
jgi:hypothetical protein